ncbi:unnamed protein product [Natator depressus]
MGEGTGAQSVSPVHAPAPEHLLPAVEGGEPWWASLYSTLVQQPARAVSWRLLHGAVSTGVYLPWFIPIPNACPFCGMREILAHVYLQWSGCSPSSGSSRTSY